MTGHPRKLVTIVAESALEGRLVEEVSKFAVSGYTITDARGTGSRGKRAAHTKDTGNIRCEVICKDVVAASLVELLLAQYGENYALVVYISDVTVMRDNKF